MLNAQIKAEGSKLTITVDLEKDHGPSKSGKTIIVASTQGNQTINTERGPVVVGLNVYKHR